MEDGERGGRGVDRDVVGPRDRGPGLREDLHFGRQARRRAGRGEHDRRSLGQPQGDEGKEANGGGTEAGEKPTVSPGRGSETMSDGAEKIQPGPRLPGRVWQAVGDEPIVVDA
jgi:hypothetical protein